MVNVISCEFAFVKVISSKFAFVKVISFEFAIVKVISERFPSNPTPIKNKVVVPKVIRCFASVFFYPRIVCIMKYGVIWKSCRYFFFIVTGVS